MFESKPRIVVGAWFPVPPSRPDLEGVFPFDHDTLTQILDELQQQLPDYEIVQEGHAMGGMYGPPAEAIRWIVDVQVPWDDLASPAARIVIEVIRGAIAEWIDRRKRLQSPYDPPADQQIETVNEAIESIPIYGPRGQLLSTVEGIPTGKHPEISRHPSFRKLV